MNIVVVLLYANAEWFNICSGVTLTTGLWLHTGWAAHRRSECILFMSSDRVDKHRVVFLIKQ